MRKRMLVMLGAVFVFVALIGGYKVTRVRAAMAMMKQMAPPPAAVTTVKVESKQWQPGYRLSQHRSVALLIFCLIQKQILTRNRLVCLCASVIRATLRVRSAVYWKIQD